MTSRAAGCAAGLLVVLFSVLVAPGPVAVDAGPAPPAFPGATGFGAGALGGRGGDVYVVTTLVDSGPGSLRDAVDSAAGPRTVTFAVSGIIDLSRPLRITGTRLTIAGQTSPGGVTLRGYPVEVVDASHVVLRYLRFRPGDVNAAPVAGRPGRGNADLPGDAADSLSILGSEHVIVDHVSASWSMDETLSVTKSADVTVQYSIISEALNDSYHPEGKHGRGSLVRGTGSRGYTFARNLWAHHQRRMPGIGGQQDPPPPGQPGQGLDVDIVNNVMYDWQHYPTHTLADPYDLRVNLEGNTYIVGPSLIGCACIVVNFEATADELSVYAVDNLVDPDADGRFQPRAATTGDLVGPATWVTDRFAFPRLQPDVLEAGAGYQDVLCRAGASNHRDGVDARIVSQVETQTGAVIDSQDEVGGWPAHGNPLPPTDADTDGMSDAWERARGLDPADAQDRNGHELDAGYTNLEMYLAELATDPPSLEACLGLLEESSPAAPAAGGTAGDAGPGAPAALVDDPRADTGSLADRRLPPVSARPAFTG